MADSDLPYWKRRKQQDQAQLSDADRGGGDAFSYPSARRHRRRAGLPTASTVNSSNFSGGKSSSIKGSFPLGSPPKWPSSDDDQRPGFGINTPSLSSSDGIGDTSGAYYGADLGMDGTLQQQPLRGILKKPRGHRPNDGRRQHSAYSASDDSRSNDSAGSSSYYSEGSAYGRNLGHRKDGHSRPGQGFPGQSRPRRHHPQSFHSADYAGQWQPQMNGKMPSRRPKYWNNADLRYQSDSSSQSSSMDGFPMDMGSGYGYQGHSGVSTGAHKHRRNQTGKFPGQPYGNRFQAHHRQHGRAGDRYFPGNYGRSGPASNRHRDDRSYSSDASWEDDGTAAVDDDMIKDSLARVSSGVMNLVTGVKLTKRALEQQPHDTKQNSKFARILDWMDHNYSCFDEPIFVLEDFQGRSYQRHGLDPRMLPMLIRESRVASYLQSAKFVLMKHKKQWVHRDRSDDVYYIGGMVSIQGKIHGLTAGPYLRRKGRFIELPGDLTKIRFPHRLRSDPNVQEEGRQFRRPQFFKDVLLPAALEGDLSDSGYTSAGGVSDTSGVNGYDDSAYGDPVLSLPRRRTSW